MEVSLNRSQRTSDEISADLLRMEGGWCALEASDDQTDSPMLLEERRDNWLGAPLSEGRLYSSGRAYVEYVARAKGSDTYDLAFKSALGLGAMSRGLGKRFESITLQGPTLTTVTREGDEQRCNSGK
jgi:hypothetical protein